MRGSRGEEEGDGVVEDELLAKFEFEELEQSDLEDELEEDRERGRECLLRREERVAAGQKREEWEEEELVSLSSEEEGEGEVDRVRESIVEFESLG